MNLNEMYQKMGIDKDVYTYGQKIAEELKERFAAIDETAEYTCLAADFLIRLSLPKEQGQ